MKLNQDCIRDLLLYLEDNLSYENTISINNLKLKDYSSDTIMYTADKLHEAGYIDCLKGSSDNYPILIATSISFTGHQYLDAIRDDSIWLETKNKLSKIGTFSLTIIQQLAISIAKAKLNI